VSDARPDIAYRAEGALGRLELNRPDVGNRITDAMMEQLRDHLRAADDVAVLVVEGAGEDFCLGRQQGGPPTPAGRRASLGLAVDVVRAIDAFPGLLVSSVRGRAVGFGAGLVVKSDVALLSDDATVGFDEILHGFPPMIVMSYLASRVTRRHALDLVVTGREVSADEALAIGMASRVVAADDLASETEFLAEHIAGLDSRAVRRAKRYLAEVESVGPADRLAYALNAQLEWFDGTG